jgi:hypothetical protein
VAAGDPAAHIGDEALRLQLPADSMEIAAVPAATIRELKRAYGPRLFVLYVADVDAGHRDAPDPLELAMLASCARYGVTCASTRAAMLAERRRGVITRGFATTTLGEGHLNASGHRLAGQIIWEQLRRSDR